MLDINWLQEVTELVKLNVWLFQGEIFFQIHVLQNLWVSNVLMSSYILCKILSFQARVAQKVFNTSGSYSAELIMLWLFNYQNWFICSSIRKWIVYANEANIVTVLWQARSSNLFAHQHTLAPITFAKLCAGIPVEKIPCTRRTCRHYIFKTVTKKTHTHTWKKRQNRDYWHRYKMIK